MRKFLFSAVAMLVGCSGANGVVKGSAPKGVPVAADSKEDGARASGSWIGTAAESDALSVDTDEATLGVWVDTPKARAHVRTPVDVALVIDTSGSMAGAKLENARKAALELVDRLAEGDIVSVDTFDDEAHVLVAPTTLDPSSRTRIRSQVSELHVGGSTNLHDGLALGEAHVARAPQTHAVRRVVVISDGIANVGPSTPAQLGALAERGVKFHAQVTSLGVGNDYDENTLNALAVRSSGRLYHIDEPKELVAMIEHEVGLLQSTVASDAFVEVVPASGVDVIGADGVRTERGANGALRIPLGVLFGGQHREALVRVRVHDMAKEEETGPRPLASVRLHFRDPEERDLERVQETIARAVFTRDASVVAARVNAKTQAIMAVQTAAKLEEDAAQQVNKGDFRAADDKLAVAEKKLQVEASATRDETERARLTAAAHGMTTARAATKAAAAAPAQEQRSQALKLNARALDAMGY